MVCRLVAMSGKMGSGKDTVGAEVARRLAGEDGHVIHTSFAGPLRLEVTALMRTKDMRTVADAPVPSTGLDDVIIARAAGIIARARAEGAVDAWSRTPSTRVLLQWWGTDVRRRVDPDWWVRRERFEIEENLATPGAVVYATDARFPNELDMIRSIGGVVIRLDAPEAVRVARIISRDGVEPTRAQLDHASETACDGYTGYDAIVDAAAPVDDVVADAMRAIVIADTAGRYPGVIDGHGCLTEMGGRHD